MSILDLLKKRSEDRQLGFGDYVVRCIKVEAGLEAGKIDVTRLESSLAAVAMTVDEFEAAVTKQREVGRLRAIIAKKGDAAERLQSLKEHAASVRADNEREITTLQAGIAEADAAVVSARHAVQEIEKAELQLRSYESENHRDLRTSLKAGRAGLAQRKREIEQRILDLRSDVANAGARSFTLASHRERWLADSEAEIARLLIELGQVCEQLGLAESAEQQAEREVLEHVAGG